MSPIVIEEEAINDALEKRMKIWLHTQECLGFQAYLESEAARLSAESGNAMVTGGEAGKIDAENHAADARCYQRLSELMSEMRDPSKHFTTAKMKPKPVIITP